MSAVTEVLFRDADGDEFPIGIGRPLPTAPRERESMREEALKRLRLHVEVGDLRPREPVEFVSIRER